MDGLLDFNFLFFQWECLLEIKIPSIIFLSSINSMFTVPGNYVRKEETQGAVPYRLAFTSSLISLLLASR